MQSGSDWSLVGSDWRFELGLGRYRLFSGPRLECGAYDSWRLVLAGSARLRTGRCFRRGVSNWLSLQGLQVIRFAVCN